ncbi:MAG: TonB-dependent receptor [Bacteroidales bacterium]|nr:TonB-dependent receptor [Bacteroidales bacterium]
MERFYRKLIFLLAALLLSLQLQAQQKYTVSGYVTDASSGEPIIGAAIIDKESSQGCITENSGFYSLSLPEGSKTLIISCLGYSDALAEIHLKGNVTLNIRLEEQLDRLSEAVVTAHTGGLGAKGTQMSAIEVPISQIKTIPAIGGEVDVIKALQLLPGVQSGTEGTAGIYVRGGGADENLLMMDGVPLYNVNHLFGFFSVFNADALKNVTLYKGNFPARFGSHLSSVIDVRMNDGNDSEYHGSASIGLISSKINVEGPIVKGHTTFNVSARRTYFDILAQPVIAYINKQNAGKDYEEKTGGGYDFYDFNAKITHRFNNDDRLSLCVYSGDDNAHVKITDKGLNEQMVWNPSTGTGTPSGIYYNYKDETRFTWRWGNFLSSLRWNHTVSPKVYMSAALSYTQYKSRLAVGVDSYSAMREGRDGDDYDISSSNGDVGYISLIDDLAGNVEFAWHPEPRHDVKFGGLYTFHTFKPGIISLKQAAGEGGKESETLLDQKVGDSPTCTHESALFIEDNWAATPWLKANVGARLSMYNVGGRAYFSAEPRVGLRALATDKLSFKASYSEMSQYIHLLCNSNVSLPSDLWVPVTRNIRPMRSRQAAAGVFYDLGKFDLSAEVYGKTMDNVLEYKDGASYLGTSTGWEEKVSQGRGWAYGLELFVQKKMGRTTGWIGYTLARTMRCFDRPGQMINDGNPFPAKYDRRHDLSMTVTHTFSRKFDLSATFVYASGNCGTIAFEEFYAYDVGGIGEAGGHDFQDGYYGVGYIPGRNNYRMPPYNRMDIGMNFYRHHKRGQGIWNISVYNVYNSLNPFMITTNVEQKWDEELHQHTSRTYLSKVSIFPVLPSFSYTYKF